MQKTRITEGLEAFTINASVAESDLVYARYIRSTPGHFEPRR
jgi:hypothetical protein